VTEDSEPQPADESSEPVELSIDAGTEETESQARAGEGDQSDEGDQGYEGDQEHERRARHENRDGPEGREERETDEGDEIDDRETSEPTTSAEVVRLPTSPRR
jgi:hypothetical protein